MTKLHTAASLFLLLLLLGMSTASADWLITANNATAYYRNVVDAVGGQAAADEFVR